MNDHTTDYEDARGEAAAPGSPEAFSALMASIRALGPQDRQRLLEQADGAEVGFGAYALGQEYLERGDWSGAQRWLGIANRHGVPGAANDLDRALLCELAELDGTQRETGGTPWSFTTALPRSPDPSSRIEPPLRSLERGLAGSDSLHFPARCSAAPADGTGGQENEEEVLGAGDGGPVLIADARRQAAQILADARRQAAQILADARRQAAQILADARRQAAQILADARRQAAPLFGSVDMLEEISAHVTSHLLAMIAKPDHMLVVVDDLASLQPGGLQYVRRMLYTAASARREEPAAKPDLHASLLKVRSDLWHARFWLDDQVSSRHIAPGRAFPTLLRQQPWESSLPVAQGSFVRTTKLKPLEDIDMLLQFSQDHEPVLWSPHCINLVNGAGEPCSTALWWWAHHEVAVAQLSEPPRAHHDDRSVVPGCGLHHL